MIGFGLASFRDSKLRSTMERNSVQTVTLTNSIIGVGILSMPFCFQKCGVLLSLVLLLLSSYITKLVCSYMIKSAIISRRKNFEQIACYSFGFYGKLLVELCVVGYLLGTCVAYYVVVGDLGPQITAKILSLNESSTLRSWVMIAITAVCIVPLGLLRNVDSLSSVCTASLGFYLCLVLKVMAESSEQISKTGWFDRLEMWKTEGILQCLPIFSMALSCQMQLFEVYATMPTTSLDKMSHVIQRSTNICACIYALIGFFGYVAFSGHRFSGNILVDFTPSFVSDIIKIGFVLSVAFSFPLAIFPCRASLYSLLYKRSYSDTHYYIPESKFRPLTVAIVLVALLLGLAVPSVEVVIGLVGSTIGVAVCIIIPAACYMHICKTNITEKQLAQVMIGLGFLIMILGTYANLEAMTRVPEKKYESILERKVTPPPPVLVADKPEQQLDDKFTALKPEQPRNTQPVTEKIQPKIEEPVTVKAKVSHENEKAVVSETPDMKDAQILQKKEEIVVDQDAILKEEKEIAVEEKEKIQQEISELKNAKKELEAQVQNIKEQLVKKNEETQQLVLKKFDEIVEKIDQKVSKEKESPDSAKAAAEEPPNRSIPGLQKDPIVRLLTEQGKTNAKLNETEIENNAKIESNVDSAVPVEVLHTNESSKNKTDIKTEDQQQQQQQQQTVAQVPSANTSSIREEKKEEEMKPLPPLPVEQNSDQKVTERSSDVDAKSQRDEKKDDGAGSKRDLLSIRNKRNIGLPDAKGGNGSEMGRNNEKDANCIKTEKLLVDNGDANPTGQTIQQDHNILDDLIGKGKIENMIRSDILMDDSKLFKK